MHPIIEKAIENERRLTQEFKDQVAQFNERCTTYLRNLWGYEEEGEEEPEGDVEDTLSNSE